MAGMLGGVGIGGVIDVGVKRECGFRFTVQGGEVGGFGGDSHCHFSYGAWRLVLLHRLYTDARGVSSVFRADLLATLFQK